ncbi:MAG TPA: 1-pyrroline-5-carboxylate dehydrogenase, partial [Vicinamibacteria bacterium]
MTNAVIQIPEPINEPLLSYAPGSPERKTLKAQLKEMLATEIEVPILVGGKEVRTGDLADIRVPHDHGHLLGRFHKANAEIVAQAEKAAAAA